jgi:sugar transferase (PEP-CTERM/EpsH1 system associated)
VREDPELLMKELKLLLVTTKLPYPPTDGGRILVFQSVKGLAARGHRIVMLCFGAGQSPDIAQLQRLCQVQVVNHDTRTRPAAALRSLFSPLPYTISKYNASVMQERIHHVLAEQQFDLVHLEHLHMAHYAAVVKRHGLPVLLREQNVESLLTARFARGTSKLERLYSRLQSGKMRRYEASACEQADLCLAVSEVDAQRLQQLNPRIKTAVVPAGADLQYFKPALNSQEEPLTVVSVAAMDWLPNVDGVIWFCDQVLPQVREQIPQVRLYVVGKNPPPSVEGLVQRGGIVVTGFVEDIRDYLARSSVVVVPMRMGSGMRIRILEAMSMGKAIVSTSIGAEGTKVNAGQDIILADTAADFAQSVVRLLQDPNLRRCIGSSARKLVERCYSWEMMTDLLERSYQSVLEGAWRSDPARAGQKDQP